MATKLHVGNMLRTSTNDEIDNDKDVQSAINRLNFSQYGGRTIGVSRARNGAGKTE